MRVIVVYKESTYSQVAPLGSAKKSMLLRMKVVHNRHQRFLAGVQSTLNRQGIKPWMVEGAGVAFDSRSADLVITVGGDGTLLGASHHVGSETPVLALNSDPKTSFGHFCADEYFLTRLNNLPTKKVTRMEVQVNKYNSLQVVSRRVLNEALFCHSCPAATSKFKRGHQAYVGSGAWISTGAGSTGAIASSGGYRFMKMWDRQLQFIEREPVIRGPVSFSPKPEFRKRYTLISQMTEATLYLDGPFLQAPVGLGEQVIFKVSKEHLTLVRE